MNRSRIDAYIREKEALPDITRESLDALKLKKLNALAAAFIGICRSVWTVSKS